MEVSLSGLHGPTAPDLVEWAQGTEQGLALNLYRNLTVFLALAKATKSRFAVRQIESVAKWDVVHITTY